MISSTPNMLSLRFRFAPLQLAVVCFAIASLAMCAAAYPACQLGDAACGTSRSGAYCCPNGASVLNNNGVVTCTGGRPAGCAATAQSQPVWTSCSEAACSSSGAGTKCYGYNTAAGNTFSLGTINTLCSTGQRTVFTELTAVRTSGPSSATTTWADSFASARTSLGRALTSTGSSSSCITLNADYEQMGYMQFMVTCPSGGSSCAGKLNVAYTCVDPPTDTMCDSTGSTCKTANDGISYCCSSSATPTFKYAGMCVCPLPAVNGGWTDFGACSASCGGGGIQVRNCTNPAPSNGGATCSGVSSQTCNTQSCSGTGSTSSTGSSSAQSYDPTVWLGTYTIASGCDQSRCCCARTSTVTTSGDSYIVTGTDLAGQCGTSVPASVQASAPTPSSDAVTYSINGQVHTAQRQSDGSIVDTNTVSASCSATLTKTSLNSAGARSAAFLPLVLLVSAAAALVAF